MERHVDFSKNVEAGSAAMLHSTPVSVPSPGVSATGGPPPILPQPPIQGKLHDEALQSKPTLILRGPFPLALKPLITMEIPPMRFCPRAIVLAFLSIHLTFSQTNVSKKPPQAEFILLGTVHDMHMKPEMRFSLLDLRHQIESIKPDLICLEIEPEAFNSLMEGYFPPEAAYIAAIANELHVRVVPTDWRIAKEWQDRATRQVPKDVEDRISCTQEEMLKAIQRASSQPSIFDFFHGEFQQLADRQFMQNMDENSAADISSGAWHERNRRIVENALDAAGDAKKILFLYGAAHLPQIARELADHGFASHLAPRRFTPCGIQPLSPVVLSRWRRNLENLKAIRDGLVKVTRDSYLKVVGCNRIANLEEALAVYGGAGTS